MDKGPQYKFLSAGEHGCYREFFIRESENIWSEVLFLAGSQCELKWCAREASPNSLHLDWLEVMLKFVLVW